jgi:hypothetical protein
VEDVVDQLAADHRTGDDSWFVTDDRGRQVYRFPPREPDHDTTLGRYFHWRDYFHGLGRELDPATPVGAVAIRSAPGLSAPFRSQASDQYMVAIATPIRSESGDRVIGVLARTIRLTALLHQWEVRIAENGRSLRSGGTAPVRFLALGDARGEGIRLLDHPAMTQARLASLAEEERPGAASPLTIDPVLAQQLESTLRCDRYLDPVAAIDSEYDGEWLAAAAPVGQTGWLAIVQERRDITVQPVDNLRRVVVRAGLLSLGIFSGLLLLLWYLIHRASV